MRLVKTGSIASLAAVAAIALLPFGAASSASNDSEKLSWISKYDTALAEAKRTGRPLFLEFRCVP